MSREEAMNALIESGMELRRDDIELGKKLERERILQAVELWRNNLLNGKPYTDEELAAQRDGGYSENFDYLIALIKGERK